ncbi:hypothetical protein KUCAC02_002855, partial [Chaenocephalus aceratus]
EGEEDRKQEGKHGAGEKMKTGISGAGPISSSCREEGGERTNQPHCSCVSVHTDDSIACDGEVNPMEALSLSQVFLHPRLSSRNKHPQKVLSTFITITVCLHRSHTQRK